MTIINNAFSGALAAQAALNATSQNVANVMTPGYTRQGVVLATMNHANAGGKSPGDGVLVNSLIRFSDNYKVAQMWSAASELGRHANTQPYLAQLEQVMGDDAASINTGLDGFFGALNAASVEPGSSPLRQQVITMADAMSQRFNSLRQVLAVQRQSVHQQRTSMVSQINQTTADIATLNGKIAADLALGNNPSGLIDQRDNKIDALAGMVGVQVIDQPDGTKSLNLRGGQPLVVGNRSSTMTIEIDITGAQTLKLDFANETFTVLTGSALGGGLGGLEEFETKVLSPLTQSIVDMAQGIADKFNTQLSAGFAIDGTPGKPLFVVDPISTTALMSVDATLVSQDLAFSSDPAQPGNSQNLLAVIALKDQPITVSTLGTVLLGDVYTQLVGRLGSDSQQNKASVSTAQTVRTQAEANWKSTSGVNNDEEAINLMQFQQMYQANMKVIAVANQLFDSTLAMFN